MKRLLGPMALLCFVACSNPISPHSESIQSYHSQNTLCNSLRFDQPTVSGADLRAIVSCLNSNHELEPLSNLVNTLSSDDLTAGASLFNDAAKNHPQDLFTVRESYRYLTKNGELPALEKQFQGLLSDPKYADSFSKILTRTSDLVSEIVFSPEHTFDPEGFYFLSKLPAFKRLSSEFLSGPSTEKVLGLLSNYFADPRHRSFKRLYQLSRAHALSSRWNDLLKSEPKVHLQNLAHFFDWLVSGGNFEFISKNIEDLKTLPVQCFNQSKTIDQPLFTVLSKIQAMSSSEAALFLSHDIKNLYLVSQAYCSYPVKFSALIAKVEEGTKIPGYTEIFSLIQPFLQDDDFISLVADPSSRDLFSGAAWVKDTHFFIDLFSTIEGLNRSSIAVNENATLDFFDRLLTSITPELIPEITPAVSMFFNPSENHAEKISTAYWRWSNMLPTASKPLDIDLQKSLKGALSHGLQNKNLSSTLQLLGKLIEQQKLDGFVEQFFTYFESSIERGRFKFVIKTAPTIAPDRFFGLDVALEKIIPQSELSSKISNACSLDWNFNEFNPAQSTTYERQFMDSFVTVDSNETLNRAKELIEYSIQNNYWATVTQLQADVVNASFQINTPLTLKTARDFLKLKRTDLNHLQTLIQNQSQMMGLVSNAFLPLQNIRGLVSKLLSDTRIYSVIRDLMSAKAATAPKTPTLDLITIKKIETLVTKDNIQTISPEDGLRNLFTEYCPTQNTSDGSCDIDDDQVALFVKSPTLLYQKIVQEYLNSSQTWLHPKKQSTWAHGNPRPENVSEIEYHLHPALHLLREDPAPIQALSHAFQRFAHDGLALEQFLNDRATRVSLIPYYFANPNYPSDTRHEYSSKIRLRLVNDLDRLEILANNGDFKALGILANTGMGMIRDVALAWGDVPPSDRPKTLVNFVSESKTQTLGEVKESIKTTLKHFDHGLVRSLAGHDITARLFNLRFVIPLLDEEIPAAQGGRGGLEFLRDLFYSLYENNPKDQRDRFSNGTNLKDECIDSPLFVSETSSKCKKDLLTLIPRVTHLGLLHQAGIAIIQRKDNPIDAISSILTKVMTSSDLSTSASEKISKLNGIRFLLNAFEFGFQVPAETNETMVQLSKILANTTDSQWVELVLTVVSQNPDLPLKGKSLLNTILSIHLDDSIQGISPFVNDVSLGLNESTRNEASSLLGSIQNQSDKLSPLLMQLLQGEPMSGALKDDSQQWISFLASPEGSHYRESMARWVSSSSLDQFCVVYSDSIFAEKLFQFLNSIYQNNDSSLFVDSCEEFFRSH